jgi:hypothetical protein
MAVRKATLVSVGGLGNQLFIWAFAHQLLYSGFGQVRIVSNWHKAHPDRPFLLKEIGKCCSHNIKFVESDAILKLGRLSGLFHSKKVRVFRHLPQLVGIRSEVLANLYPQSIPLNSWLFIGYFQNVDLYSHLGEVIDEINDFVSNKPTNLQVGEGDFQVAHIRRGDYLNHRTSFGVLSDEYFINQINRNLRLIILCENVAELGKSIQQIPNSIVIDSTQSNVWDVLHVLAKGKKVYLSNSSLSWWGGSIAARNGSQVFAPSPWFREMFEKQHNLHNDAFFHVAADWLVDETS